MKRLHIEKTVFISLLSCVGLILGYVESFIPLFSAFPGIKIGTSNIVVLITLYKLSVKDALMVGVFKALLSSVLFAGIMSVYYSLPGVILSVIIMWLFKVFFCNRVSVIGVSILGSAFFNIGQILSCCVILSSFAPMYYLGIFLIFSVLCGALTGYISKILLSRI